MPEDRIYLDHQATTPVDERVLDAMLPYFTQTYGNAASNDHLFGVEAKRGVDEARSKIAKAIGAKPDEIIFTSGATESDNMALFGVARRYAGEGNHIITCQTEHKAVLDCCEELEGEGWRVTYLPVDEHGMVSTEDVREAVCADTVLISIMAANNEVGTIQPLTEIGKVAEEKGVLFHTDAAQAVGHIPIDVKAMNIHLMSFSAHKCYGPKGVGALYRRRSNPRVNLKPQMFGGGHERGLRSGTLNVPAIVGFGEAVALGQQDMDADSEHYLRLTNRMFDTLRERLGDVERNGHPTERLAHNLNVHFPGIESRALVVDLKDVAVATGSACTSAHVEPSHVVTAMHSEERAHCSIRISLGRGNTNEQTDAAVERIAGAVEQLQAFSS